MISDYIEIGSFFIRYIEIIFAVNIDYFLTAKAYKMVMRFCIRVKPLFIRVDCKFQDSSSLL